MKKSFLLVGLSALLLIGAGCNTSSTQSVQPDTSIVPAEGQANWKEYSSTLFKNLSFKFPSTYTIADGKDGNLAVKWVDIKKDDIAKVEIFRMSDFDERPFGFTGDESQKDFDAYVPKEQLQVKGFDVWVYYEKDDTKTREELMKIVETIQVN